MTYDASASDLAFCLPKDRSPEALANLLEAAGGLALERAGAILDQRFPELAE